MSAGLNPAEEAADLAWQDYAASSKLAQTVWSDPRSTPDQKRGTFETALRAENRFKRLFALLDAPTPPDLIDERNHLVCEGAMLVAAIGGSLGLLAPAVVGDPGGIFLLGILAGELARWSYRFATKLIPHIRRRM